MPKLPETRLTLGPVLFLWTGEEWRDFYFRIADEAPVDIVTLGEVVCSKRQHFAAPYLPEVAERLQRAGKTVKLASLALVTLAREQRAVRELAEQDDYEVEANDLSAFAALAGRHCTIGPFVNVYNEATARFLHAGGARTICLPPELPQSSVRAIAKGCPDVSCEVFAFGRVPLAMSARCAHARAKGHTKDNCQFVCGEDPDGLDVETLDGQSFLALNGIQTLSHACHTTILETHDLLEAGIRGFRLSPQRCDMVSVARTYRGVISGMLSPEEGLATLRTIYPDVPLANGFLHAMAGAEFADASGQRASRLRGIGDLP
jgi:O2-independent ubiquinone biosynthesis protein UbiV